MALWIESHCSLRDHVKLARLMRALSISKAEAVGLLHLLWWWAARQCEDGDLTGLGADDVAFACEWGGDPASLLAGLQQAGFIDAGPLRLHDWNDYHGRLLAARAASADRMRRWRERAQAEPVTRNERATNAQRTRNAEPQTARRTGTRLPADAALTGDHKSEAQRIMAASGVALDPAAMWDAFRDYWVAAPGQRGVKLDWMATWRTWVRNECNRAPAWKRGAPQPSDAATVRARLDAELAEESARRARRANAG